MPDSAERPNPYRNVFMDNARWEAITLRADDIIISTPVKCGTTWTQTICALLVFGTADLPADIDQLSPWVDLCVRPRADLADQVEAQRHPEVAHHHRRAAVQRTRHVRLRRP